MFDFLFNPNGRISRKGYGIGFFVPYLLLVTLPGLLLVNSGAVGIYITVIGLFFLWPSLIAVPVKRFHDLGRSGWWHILVLVIGAGLSGYASVPLVMQAFEDPSALESLEQGKNGLQMTAATFDLIKDSPDRAIAFILGSVVQYGEMLFFLIAPGQRDANRFGGDPLASGRGFAD